FTGFENLNLGSNETVILNNTSLSIHGVANDVLTLGSGNDSVVFTGGNDAVTLGSGNDSVTFASSTDAVNAPIGTGATLHTGDVLTGGTGPAALDLPGARRFSFNTNPSTTYDNRN